MDWRSYSSSQTHHWLWIDAYFQRVGLPFPLPAVLLGLAPFTIGLALAVFGGFVHEYLGTLPIYLGSIGLFWTSAVMRYASISIHSVFESLRPCFIVSDSSFRDLLNGSFSRVANRRANATWIAVLWVLALLVTILSFWFSDVSHDVFGLEGLRPSLFFPNADLGLAGSRMARAAVVLAYGTFIAAVLGPLLQSVGHIARLVGQISRLPVIPVPDLIKHRMSGLTSFAVALSVSYFFGVGLVAVLLLRASDVPSLISLVAVSLVGVLIFAVPQIVYVRLIAESISLRNRVRLHCAYRAIGVELRERPPGHMPAKGFEALCAAYDSSQLAERDEAKRFVYSSTDVVWVLIGQGGTIAGFLFETGGIGLW